MLSVSARLPAAAVPSISDSLLETSPPSGPSAAVAEELPEPSPSLAAALPALVSGVLAPPLARALPETSLVDEEICPPNGPTRALLLLKAKPFPLELARLLELTETCKFLELQLTELTKSAAANARRHTVNAFMVVEWKSCCCRGLSLSVVAAVECSQCRWSTGDLNL